LVFGNVGSASMTVLLNETLVPLPEAGVEAGVDASVDAGARTEAGTRDASSDAPIGDGASGEGGSAATSEAVDGCAVARADRSEVAPTALVLALLALALRKNRRPRPSLR
ncbi:MAG: hypothetical protein JWM74_6117, partial [Myxococcaceae bacterium]|nr:hypothetical protein [Myxococcaceae bacterium]